MMLFTEPRIPVLTALSVLVALTWVTLSLRLWVRLAVTRSSGWDDAFLTLSAVSNHRTRGRSTGLTGTDRFHWILHVVRSHRGIWIYPARRRP